MKREELQAMDKDAIIDICLKQEKELVYRESVNKWNSEEKQRLEDIVKAITLVLNNYKK